ncbi:MAG: hypothetical protein J6J12_04910 [Oscillospiraceae bacterium]|nr:hypothetical protein [Oscillospiraceae bacterium]
MKNVILILFLEKSLKKLFIARLTAGERYLPAGNTVFVSCTKTRQRNVSTAFLGGNATEPLNAAPIKRFHRFIKN